MYKKNNILKNKIIDREKQRKNIWSKKEFKKELNKGGKEMSRSREEWEENKQEKIEF